MHAACALPDSLLSVFDTDALSIDATHSVSATLLPKTREVCRGVTMPSILSARSIRIYVRSVGPVSRYYCCKDDMYVILFFLHGIGGCVLQFQYSNCK